MRTVWPEGCGGGDPELYERLIRDHGGRMMAVARRFLRDDEEARDVVQDSLLEAFRSAGTFRGDAAISTWLHRIVVNTALMRLRAERVRPAPVPMTAFRWRISRVSENACAESRLLRKEMRAIVRRSVSRLPSAYREVVTLRDLEELDTAETARHLGVSRNAVKLRLHRGRQDLAAIVRAASN